MIKTAIVKKLKSKLSDIAKYLEEAGMCGAKELRKAMDAIDGSFTDDTDYLMDSSSIPDNQLANTGSVPVALHGGFGGRPSFDPGASVLVGSTLRSIVSGLIKMANKLDSSGHYDEAGEVDEILKELLSGKELKIIKDLEEQEDNKDNKRVKPTEDGEDEKEGEDVLVQSNGRVPTSVSQTSGFNGLSDAYFFTSYTNLEPPYGG